MPFVPDGRGLIRQAYAEGRTMAAFNVCSAEMVRACLEAAEAEDTPVILQAYPADLEQVAPRHMAALVKSMAEDVGVPVMLHLDHGPTLELAYACLRAGFSSVMFDGAGLGLNEVVRTSARLAEVAHAQEAALEVAADSFSGAGALTRPEDALRLKNESGADMVAVAVGSEHGADARLELGLLARIAASVQGPLVLHGGSGVSAPDLVAAGRLGVVKVNIGSALYRALRASWLASGTAKNHREGYANTRVALFAVARAKLRALRGESTVI